MFGFVTAAAKGTRTCLWPKKVRLENTRNYEIYNPQALSSALAVAPRRFCTGRISHGRHSQGLWVINSIDPCVLKSNYYLELMIVML